MKYILAAFLTLCVSPALATIHEPQYDRGIVIFKKPIKKYKAKKHRHKHIRVVKWQHQKVATNIFKRYAAASTSLGCLTQKTRSIVEQLKERFGSIAIVSTCRPGAMIAGTGRPSYHRWGMAVDFTPLEAKKKAVVNWLYDQKVLVMTYFNQSHIHFNIGQGQRKILLANANGSRKRHHRRYAKI